MKNKYYLLIMKVDLEIMDTKIIE